MIRVGLDIGSLTVKCIQIEKKKRKILGFGVQEILNGNVKEAVLRVAKEVNLKTKRVNISVCGPQVTTRFIPFPKLEPKEFKNSLRFEAEKYIPFGIEDVFLDGVILKEIEPDKVLALVVAAKKEFVHSKCNLVKDCGLEPDIVDIDSLCLCNLFNLTCESKDRVVGILNISTAYSNLVIIEDEIPIFSRDISIGSKLFIDRLIEYFSIDFPTAQRLLSEPKDKLNQIAEVLLGEISNLTSEVRASFDYYESRSGLSVERIYLCGGGSIFEGITSSLKDLLGIEIGSWDPLKSFSIDRSLDSERLNNLSKQSYVALGLALR